MKYPTVLEFDVTQEDIDNGVKGNSKLCPIAQSLKRQGYQAGVGYTTINILDNFDRFHFYKIVNKACHSILDFDRGKFIKPFKVIIEKETHLGGMMYSNSFGTEDFAND